MQNLTGKRFGKLVALRCIDASGRGSRHRWECQCDCGNITATRAYCLTRGSGQTSSCGCARDEAARHRAKGNSYAKKDLNDVYRKYMHGIVSRSARSRGYSFDLSVDDVIKLAESPCDYCGILPSNTITRYIYKFVYNGIDRVDNTIGYVLGNCVPCCKNCNYAKRKMSKPEFLSFIGRIHVYQETKNARPLDTRILPSTSNQAFGRSRIQGHMLELPR